MDIMHEMRMGGFGRRRRWSDLPKGTRKGIGLAALVQLTLLVTAALDLVRRPAAQVRGGRKWPWIPVLLMNFIGPIIYFVFGRRSRPDVAEALGHATGRGSRT